MRRFLEQTAGNWETTESGQGMVEYGLIIVLVSLAAIGALQLLSGSISGLFASIVGALG